MCVCFVIGWPQAYVENYLETHSISCTHAQTDALHQERILSPAFLEREPKSGMKRHLAPYLASGDASCMYLVFACPTSLAVVSPENAHVHAAYMQVRSLCTHAPNAKE